MLDLNSLVARLAVLLVLAPVMAPASGEGVGFNADIRPLLSDRCFHCHGPDEVERQAGLRLDVATGPEGAYESVIVPGSIVESELWNRINSTDPDLVMPPPGHHLEPLSEEDKQRIRDWIEHGAPYEDHWAFVPPKSPQLPNDWAGAPIDHFVRHRLIGSGLVPGKVADPRTLIRRLTFDLTGLPPSVAEVREFVEDYQRRGETAWQAAITRLLDSPHFGERMAVPWMDQARYADTNGYSIDGGREMWLWRDWVIRAYNDNLPFDQFLIEQLAGDLLPGATESQQIASGFNRNHMVTHEGGTIPEENLNNYVADRVKTTGEVLLGLTLGCAQCHDHKYDPISQREYYQFYAFFNSLDDRGLDGNAGVNPAPRIMARSVLASEAELQQLDAELEQLQRQWLETDEGFDQWLTMVKMQEQQRGRDFVLHDVELLDVTSPNRPGPYTFDSSGTVAVSEPGKGLAAFSHALRLPSGSSLGGAKINGLRIEFSPQGDDAPPRLTPFSSQVPQVTTVLVSADQQPTKQVNMHRQLVFSGANASSSLPGHEASGILDERNRHWWMPDAGTAAQHLTITFDEPVDPEEMPFLSLMVFFGRAESIPYRWKVRVFCGNDPDTSLDPLVAAAMQSSPAEWDESTRARVMQRFREHASSLAPLRVRLENLQERRRVLTEPHQTMVMNTSNRPRQTFVLARGQYDAPLDEVFPQTPQVLPVLQTASVASGDDGAMTATRLDLARWLVDPQHPLTARVAVNRLWGIFFGTGIVATSADFGSQGEFPSHPELLDYLATNFIANGWDQKALIREIVSSDTYRQSSAASAEQLKLDPQNRLLARGPRFRLSAEFIRDSALAVSGLLVPRIGGPSVHPYQPPGLWKEVSHFGSTPATKQVFVQDHGEKLYRRGLYTFIKRTSPHPGMAAFDAPNREMCVLERSITNTPMQALVTLNDPQFAEAARVFAARLLQDFAEVDDQARISLAMELVTSREPTENETQALLDFLALQREQYQADRRAAMASISVGEWPIAKSLDPVELAAWTQVAALLLNLSESLTRS